MMEKRWKDYRYELHQYFKKFKTAEEAHQHSQGNVTEEDVEWLCTFLKTNTLRQILLLRFSFSFLLCLHVNFSIAYLQKRPKKTTATRAELPYTHRAWSKSIFSVDPKVSVGITCSFKSILIFLLIKYLKYFQLHKYFE